MGEDMWSEVLVMYAVFSLLTPAFSKCSTLYYNVTMKIKDATSNKDDFIRLLFCTRSYFQLVSDKNFSS